MKHFLLFSVFFFIFNCSFSQDKDSFYYKKISEPTTSFIQLKEGYKIFSQHFGTGKIKILFLHGGPGDTHEYLEVFKDKLPLDKYQLFFYDQLGSYYSDQPADTTLWNINRFVEEVEQVRAFYNLNDFYLMGHSWGGLLAMEYSIKYPDKLKGLIISNKSYSQKNLVDTRTNLMIKAAQNLNASEKTREEIQNGKRISDTTEAKNIKAEFLRQHIIRMDTLPDAVSRDIKHIITKYTKYFHDRETWNILNRLQQIQAPTLIIGAKNDFVTEKDLHEMNSRIKNSTLYICPNGGHFDFWDDSTNYFNALHNFIIKNEKHEHYR